MNDLCKHLEFHDNHKASTGEVTFNETEISSDSTTHSQNEGPKCDLKKVEVKAFNFAIKHENDKVKYICDICSESTNFMNYFITHLEMHY